MEHLLKELVFRMRRVFIEVANTAKYLSMVLNKYPVKLQVKIQFTSTKRRKRHSVVETGVAVYILAMQRACAQNAKHLHP